MKRISCIIAAAAIVVGWSPRAAAQQLDLNPRFESLGPSGSQVIAPPIRLDLGEREPRRRSPERTEPREPGFGFGVQATGGYAAENELSLYGVSGVLRYSLLPHLAMELDFGLNGGDDDSLLIPISLNALAYLSLRGRLHPFLIFGAALTVLEEFNTEPSSFFGGAHMGLGMENMFTRALGLTVDLRAFILERIADDVDGIEWGLTVNYGFVYYN
jgi:hypothetical protein